MTRVVKLREVTDQFLVAIPKDIASMMTIKRGDRMVVTFTSATSVTITKEEPSASIKD